MAYKWGDSSVILSTTVIAATLEVYYVSRVTYVVDLHNVCLQTVVRGSIGLHTELYRRLPIKLVSEFLNLTHSLCASRIPPSWRHGFKHSWMTPCHTV